MADILVHREPRPTTSAISREIDPFRAMRNLLQWDPFRELVAAMPERAMAEYMPELEVKETKTAFVLRADLPGVKQGDIDVTLTGNRLTISGKRESESKEKGETYYLYERSYGSFSRALTLPSDVDAAKIHAELRDGVLTIELPKTAAMRAQKIEVKGPGAKKN